MGLGKIFEEVKDLITGTPENETPENVDPNAGPAFDEEQGIKPASEDPYGDPGQAK